MLSLTLLCLLVSECSAIRRHKRRMGQRGQLGFEECGDLEKLEAIEPDYYRIEAEGGVTESWNHTSKMLRCAGVALIRRTIKPGGLVLPSYTNAPQLMYYVQGSGIQGMTIFPSCPESFEEPQEAGEGYREQHQKVHEIRGGDIIAIPAGIGYWFYNNGDIPIVVVILLHTNNVANQLGPLPRRFYIAGNTEDEHGEGGREESISGRNVFSGISVNLLAEVFGVRVETARKMQGADDKRKNIVMVEGGLDVIRPEPGSRANVNGLEETICTLRVREAVGSAARADIYVPRAGRIATLNSIKLPILADLQLSAERGVLYKYGVYVPHWNLNAHSVMYVTGGRGRVEVADNNGKSVFDDVMKEGQVVVIPQNFVAVMHAREEGFEWIAFKTGENAMINALMGESSAIRVLPVDVVVNMYQVSREEAQRIKEARDQAILFTLPPFDEEETQGLMAEA
ncbi:hypothetical protein PIB30_011729 [Stylosanthes scabra]|uniref:Cupin type-1 domain-containing protein n=1 Tax=Stylosanthes scabra TaxID=79078 RepID=A0ABU6Y400_9FABA|nr:hypothetical protein [Stylosanthes scabra]